MDKKKEQPQNAKKTKQSDIKIKSLNIDKAEYQEIVLSNSNEPWKFLS
ncbi:MAG TPA: hypothetical protein P5556_07640 [Candidatus Gastranaerophilales bacterium]|nr:hypothetical protein [Candidatus Gastranaerophilales bacterium]